MVIENKRFLRRGLGETRWFLAVCIKPTESTAPQPIDFISRVNRSCIKGSERDHTFWSGIAVGRDNVEHCQNANREGRVPPSDLCGKRHAWLASVPVGDVHIINAVSAQAMGWTQPDCIDVPRLRCCNPRRMRRPWKGLSSSAWILQRACSSFTGPERTGFSSFARR